MKDETRRDPYMSTAAIDLRHFIGDVQHIVERHCLGGSGEYARWCWNDDAGGRDLGLNPYGCADAANLLYTVGQFPSASEHRAWISTLRSLQETGSGLVHEATHHPLHCTAHVIGALELFAARPVHPLSALRDLLEPENVAPFLEQLDWSWNPWGESHKGAGLFAAAVMHGRVEGAWQERYFEWLWRAADPETGLWRAGHVAAGGDGFLFHHLAGSFHYLFNHEHAGRPLRYPARMVDTCLRIWSARLFPPLARTVGFAELDWVYCLHRSQR
jgi:hypothetical protein